MLKFIAQTVDKRGSRKLEYTKLIEQIPNNVLQKLDEDYRKSLEICREKNILLDREVELV